MQPTIANQPEIGRGCQSDSVRVEWRPGDRVVGKTWRMEGPRLLLRVHGKEIKLRKQQENNGGYIDTDSQKKYEWR